MTNSSFPLEPYSFLSLSFLSSLFTFIPWSPRFPIILHHYSTTSLLFRFRTFSFSTFALFAVPSSFAFFEVHCHGQSRSWLRSIYPVKSAKAKLILAASLLHRCFGASSRNHLLFFFFLNSTFCFRELRTKKKTSRSCGRKRTKLKESLLRLYKKKKTSTWSYKWNKRNRAYCDVSRRRQHSIKHRLDARWNLSWTNRHHNPLRDMGLYPTFPQYHRTSNAKPPSKLQKKETGF